MILDGMCSPLALALEIEPVPVLLTGVLIGAVPIVPADADPNEVLPADPFVEY